MSIANHTSSASSPPNVVEQHFADASASAGWLAEAVADCLRAGITARGQASLVVSGGKSPVLFFQALRKLPMAWAQVTITLADERWVDPASADSNEHLLREHLLRDEAAPARFIALKSDAFTPEDGLAAVMQSLALMPRPFDAVVLGMGDDGHTASLFPGMPGVADALNPDNPAVLVAARAPVSPESRISMTMATLLDARKIFVPIAGPAKRAVYDGAKAGSPSSSRYPVAALFKQSRAPVVVLIAAKP